jgi:prepilin-type N-terminal cleavage/methylation domain-containing protein/prepilin-type processing-associated H-X9-DG protein
MKRVMKFHIKQRSITVHKQKGFTLIELLVVIAIISILMAIMLPALQRVKEQAKEMGCRANLREFGIAHAMYIDDFDGRYPSQRDIIVRTDQPPGYTSGWCRWHDARYPLGSKYSKGPFWTYMANKKAYLCPTFKVLAKSMGENHPLHDSTIPVVPQYSYSMNGFLGLDEVYGYRGALRFTDITRNKAEVFFLSEENMWLRPGCEYVLNDTALFGSGSRDWFGTFHGGRKDMNSGTVNAVFVDGHVSRVRSALGEDPKDTSQMEYGRFEKYSWPFKGPPE